MPIKTSKYNLEAFLENEIYSSIADKRRFSTIDNQLHRLAEIIGDGRIDGWEASIIEFPQMAVSPGSGFVDGYYVNTFNQQLFDLSSNSKFHVYAQHRVGIIGTTGAKSDVKSIAYIDEGPPVVPSGLALTAASAFSVNVSWSSNSETDLGHYELERSTDGVNFVLIAEIDATNVSHTDNAVDEDSTYYYQLAAVDLSGYKSPFSSTVNVITPISLDLPPNPIAVSMPASESAVTVLWSRPATILLSKISHWQIVCSLLDTDNSTISSISVQVDKLLNYERIDDLVDGQRYKITIHTVDIKGRTSTGVSMNVSPQPNPGPRDPTAITYTMQPSSSGVQVNLAWSDGDTPYDPSIAYRYKIYVNISGQESVGIDVPIGLVEEQISLYTFDLVSYFAIPENKLITMRITSVDVSGFESFGAYIRFKTDLFATPTRLANLVATFDHNHGQIIVTWTTHEDTANIRLRVLDDNLEDAYLIDTEMFNQFIGNVNRYVLTNIDLHHKYSFYLTPYNLNNEAGPESLVVSLTLIAGSGVPLPVSPNNINVSIDDREVTLTWDASQSPYVSNYIIYRKVGEITLDPTEWAVLDSLSVATTQFIDYGLTNGQTYAYYISSVDIYGRESPTLNSGEINLNFVEVIPQTSGLLTEPTNVNVSLIDNRNIHISWDGLIEEFDAFTIYRSINNLHSWKIIATVDKNEFEYTDISLPLIDQTVFYYMVDKIVNNADIIVQTTNVQPDKSIFLATITTGTNAISSIDVVLRKDIKNLVDPIFNYTNEIVLPHKHNDINLAAPSRIDLRPSMIVTDWATVDGRIFTTSELDISGSSYIVTINDRLPSTFYKVDATTRRLLFAEPIVTIDADSNQPVDDLNIKVQILGIEEVDGVLSQTRFDNVHAKQAGYGLLNTEQMPLIDHEGRTKEQLIPDRYLLERFSNNAFTIPQNNKDETKAFGDGTAFFVTIEADGKISEIIDFDHLDDGSQAGFREPSFSITTIDHLKDHTNIYVIAAPNDNANLFRLAAGGTSWSTNPSHLLLGQIASPEILSADIFLRYSINTPSKSNVVSAKLFFVAEDADMSNGDFVRVAVSILNPSGMSDAVDLQFETIAAVGTIGNIHWNPDTFLSNQSNIQVDVTSLIKLFMEHSSYYPGKPVILKITTLDYTTLGHYRRIKSYADNGQSPYLQISHVIDLSEVNSDPGGYQSEKSYNLQFEFKDTLASRWVRITSFDTENKPNPIVDLRKRIRFRLLLQAGSLYLSLGIREIVGDNHTIGDNGGTVGPIEWIGTKESSTDANGDPYPKGILINSSEKWQEIDINPRKDGIRSFDNGNNSLSANFGVLEHIAFTINPNSLNATGPFSIYIDKLEQISDVLTTGTSQGILISDDFGTSWQLSRLTDTPVHKFYRAKNNRFLWAISSTEVLLSVDPAFWFAASGTTGIQSIRDIAEDSDGNMFISTDKGVYWLEISLIGASSSFQQTQAVSSFTTDCYAIYVNNIASGLDEIWVSTETGIFKTTDKGETWQDADMSTGGLVAYQIFNIGTNELPVIVASNRKHILRKFISDADFKIVVDMEKQHNIFDVWKIAYFNNKIYVSTGHGSFVNPQGNILNEATKQLKMHRILSDSNINNQIRHVFGLDVVELGDLGSKLFVGQENRLSAISVDGSVGIKKDFHNKELPSFFVDDNELLSGYTYNAFNGVLCFREPVLPTQIISASFIPRKKYIASNNGWATTKPDADLFIFINGIPTWIDFTMDEPSTLREIKLLQGKMQSLPTLNDFNSLYPLSQNYLTAVLSDITAIQEGGENKSTQLNNANIVKLINDVSVFINLLQKNIVVNSQLVVPKIFLRGIDRDQRLTQSRAKRFEETQGFIAEDSTGIIVDITSGEVDFLTAFVQSTSLAEKDKFTFDKFDHMSATVFKSNVDNSGEQTHRDLENAMEDINTGLTSDLARSVYANTIQTGIAIEAKHHSLFDTYNVSNVQSKFYASHTNNWYDRLHSTIDFDAVFANTRAIPDARFVKSSLSFIDNSDPYVTNKIWLGTDNDIFEYSLNTSDGSLALSGIFRPGGGAHTKFIWDIFLSPSNDIYVAVTNNGTNKGELFVTSDYGISWSKIDTINLPENIYSIKLFNGIKTVSTGKGVFYSDNTFGTWYPSNTQLSLALSGNNAVTTAFGGQIFNLSCSTFLVAESDRWFYTSSSGIDFFAVGRIINNNVSVVNKILRFKNLTWLATDRGLYHDSNSMLSDNVSFSLQTTMESSTDLSSKIQVNDIVSSEDAVYCCSSAGKIYRFFDEGAGNKWKSYTVSDIGSIHKLIMVESEDKQHLVAVSYNTARTIEVTNGSGVFDS